jgi:RNA polymerase sigma-70 factor (ECF subfamily)
VEATSPPILNEHEFEQLFRRYYPRLCAFAFGYLQDAAQTEETVQDVFMTLWEQRGRVSVHTSMRAYLYAAVRNRALNRSARARTEEQWQQQQLSSDAVPASDYSDVGDRVRAAIAALPPACRNALMLRWQEEMSYGEIAEALSISVKTVENNLARARALMREMLPDLISKA